MTKDQLSEIFMLRSILKENKELKELTVNGNIFIKLCRYYNLYKLEDYIWYNELEYSDNHYNFLIWKNKYYIDT